MTVPVTLACSQSPPWLPSHGLALANPGSCLMPRMWALQAQPGGAGVEGVEGAIACLSFSWREGSLFKLNFSFILCSFLHNKS